MTSVVTGLNPVGGEIQPAQGRDPLAYCGQRHWWAYQRHRGECRGQSPVDVPAALCECWGQDFDPRAGTLRNGDQPKDWRATDPRTGGHHPKYWTGSSLLFNPDRSLAFFCPVPDRSLWFAGPGALVLLAGAVGGSGFSVCVFSVSPEADRGTDPKTGKFFGQVSPYSGEAGRLLPGRLLPFFALLGHRGCVLGLRFTPP